jgi:feruloyl esterase
MDKPGHGSSQLVKSAVGKPARSKHLAAGRLHRATRTVSALLSLWLPAPKDATETAGAGRVTAVAGFGSNPGGLRMLVYAPARLPADAPLIVVLHGCQQDAAGFAAQAGWLALARRLRCALVLPEQTAENNRGRCFNWHRPADARRDGGEAKSIRQMVSVATRRFRSDRRRVFVVGLSAGGAMAVALLAAYPATFAAGAAVAGMPVGSASSSAMALLRMHRADPFRSRTALAAAIQAAVPARSTRSWPRLSIWQGGRDRTVNPANAEALAAQWTALHGFEAAPTSETAPAPGILRRAWGRPARPAVELWTIAGMGHGFPVDPRRVDGESEGPWVVDAGLSAARHIAAFWGIDRP